MQTTLVKLLGGNLPFKIASAIALVVLLAVFVVGFLTVKDAERALRKAFFEKSVAVARIVDASIIDHKFFHNTDNLFEFIQKNIWLEPDIERMVIHAIREDHQLLVLVSSDGKGLGTEANVMNMKTFTEDRIVHRQMQHSGKRSLRLISPIHIAQGVAGTVQIDFSLDHIERSVNKLMITLIANYLGMAILILSMLFWLLKKLVVEKIKIIAGGLCNVANGNLEHRISLRSRDEIGQLADAFNNMADDLQVADKRIKMLAYHDELTGLPNRRFLLDQLTNCLKRLRERTGNGICVLLYIDIDRFKSINDSYGHEGGDQLLVDVSVRLNQLIRTDDVASRIGGDEFVALLVDMNGVSEGALRARLQEVFRVLSVPYRIRNRNVDVTVSMGVRVFRDCYSNPEELLFQADSTMYRSKNTGGNRIFYFDTSNLQGFERRSRLRRELPDVLDRNEFQVHYQPQFDSRKEVVALEALVRWYHPQYGVVKPDDFIPFAEESGFIVSMGAWVLDRALSQYEALIRSGRVSKNVKITVNVSPKHLELDAFVDQVAGCLNRHNVGGSSLELELTEQTFLQNPLDAIEKMRALLALGVEFSLDDFGTGYSSLGYLKHLPIQRLKIDRSFVIDMVEDRNDAAIIDSIIGLARHYELEVIAEGVETKEQYWMLREQDCNLFQGFLFSRPLSFQALNEFLYQAKTANQVRGRVDLENAENAVVVGVQPQEKDPAHGSSLPITKLQQACR